MYLVNTTVPVFLQRALMVHNTRLVQYVIILQQEHRTRGGHTQVLKLGFDQGQSLQALCFYNNMNFTILPRLSLPSPLLKVDLLRK